MGSLFGDDPSADIFFVVVFLRLAIDFLGFAVAVLRQGTDVDGAIWIAY